MSERLAPPIPIASYWRASEYVLRADPEPVDEVLDTVWDRRIEAHPHATWERYEPFRRYEAGGQGVLHKDFLNLYQGGGAADMVDFANKHGLLGAFSRYYQERPLLPLGKFFVAPEAVFVQGRLVPIDPETEGMALITRGKLDGLLDGEQAARERIIALLKYGPFIWTRVPDKQVAMPSEVSFVRTAVDAPTPVPDLRGEAIPWETAREGFGGFLLVLDERSPALVSVLCRSEPVGVWLYLLGMFQLACFPEPGGYAEDEMIEVINSEIAGASPHLTRSEDGRYERNWRCRDLLQSLYLMLFLDAAADKGLRKCQAPNCPYYFRVGKHDKARKYCPRKSRARLAGVPAGPRRGCIGSVNVGRGPDTTLTPPRTQYPAIPGMA